MSSVLQRVIEEQRAKLLARDAETLDRYAFWWDSVAADLSDKIDLLAADIANRKVRGETVSADAIRRLQRYQDLLAQTKHVVQEYGSKVAAAVTTEQQRLWDQGQEDALAQLSTIRGSFNTLPKAATNTALGLAGDGSPVRALLQSTWADSAEGMLYALVRNTALGRNPRVTAREMVKDAEIGLRRALTIARTEQLRAYRESSRDLYKRSGVVQRYMRLATRSPRTCILCIAADRTIYTTDEPMPIHPNCRCTSVPLVEGYTLNLGETAREWVAKQDAKTQREMFGPTIAAALRGGKLDWSKIATVKNDPVWGPTLVRFGKGSTPNVAPVAQPTAPKPLPTRTFKTANEADTVLRKQSKVTDKTISRDERAALSWYQQNGYMAINGVLRGTVTLSADNAERVQRIQPYLDSLFKRSTFPENLKTHRGMLLYKDDAAMVGLLDKLKPGMMYTERGYLSTTVDKSVIGGFGGDLEGEDYGHAYRVSMNVLVPAGSRAVYMNAPLPYGNTPEYELLIDRNAVYRVVARRENGNNVEIDVEIVGYDD